MQGFAIAKRRGVTAIYPSYRYVSTQLFITIKLHVVGPHSILKVPNCLIFSVVQSEGYCATARSLLAGP